MGFFDALKLSRLKEGLARTRESIVGKVQRILASRSTIDDELLEHLEEILLSADVGSVTTTRIIGRLRERVKKEKYQDTKELERLLREEVQEIFTNGSARSAGEVSPSADEASPSAGPARSAGEVSHSADEVSLSADSGTDPLAIPAGHRPHVIMIVGVNGVGKTTSIGKLAHAFKESGKSVLIAAADTFRAAANEQLDVWARRAGVEIIQQKQGADPAAVAFDALNAALARGTEIVIIDTAGRLHTKVNLMEELKKIGRVLQKLVPGAPHEVLLVLDASTGQNAVRQAAEFSKSVGVTGLVLTKLDGTAKGGVVMSITGELGIPVKFIGVGEQIDDLQPFDRILFVDALFAR
jgi:fused signal recognition particle receptor